MHSKEAKANINSNSSIYRFKSPNKHYKMIKEIWTYSRN